MAKKTKKPAPAPKKKTASKPAKPSPKQSPKKPVKPSKPSPKKPAPKATKPAPKAAPAPKPSAKAKPAPVEKPVVKAPEPKKPGKPVPAAPVSVPKAAPTAKSAARDSLRSKILEKSRAKAPARPISFSFDEIREIAKTSSKNETEAKAAAAKTAAKSGKLIDPNKLEKSSQPHHIKAASLADILGFNPRKAKQPDAEDDSNIQEKFRRYYRLLLDLRNHLTGQIDTHSEETLKRSAKDDAGDLSSYGQHMADAGTDTFDRDFALSLVSSCGTMKARPVP